MFTKKFIFLVMLIQNGVFHAMIQLPEENKIMFIERKHELLNKIKAQFGNSGPIVLIANFENACCSFHQESSFFYYTGITEPGCIVVIAPEGDTTLYIPRFQESRSKWIGSAIDCADGNIEGIDKIEYLGEPIKGYHLSPASDLTVYSTVLSFLKTALQSAQQPFYTLLSSSAHENPFQKVLLWRFFQEISALKDHVKDISQIVAAMRRKKSLQEVESIKKAIDITRSAHQEAARAMRQGAQESDVHMALEAVMRRSGATTAFPSIVACGKNSCVLHYTKNCCPLTAGELVVVDIGAQVEGYCADITRTYAVSGTFSQRQQEIYDLVLATQKYVEHHARPGMWLSNKEQPNKSLHHLAVEFLKKRGYEKCFTHGIGHFLGLDVHDVGDGTQPLAEGDVITIEPGIYISEESLGVRIEDDYLITSSGAECLSADIPK